MNKDLLIQRTINTMAELPDDKAGEIADFATFIKNRYEEESLKAGLTQLVADSKSFSYLEQEEETYTLQDCKEIYQ